ncbi:MAG: MerR family transcriptional regulator [Cellulosilyticaceae bacterium]
MKDNFAYFTTNEFAKLHHLNKRTLHYYDEIGLFSPKHKGDNGYRYYTFEQSMELENILALRELGMSILEIKDYTQNPNPSDFLKLAHQKIEEIDTTIAKLKKLKAVFVEKQDMLHLCSASYDTKIEMVDLKDEYLLLTPLPLHFQSEDALIQNTRPIMEHLRTAWEFCTYKKSCGSFISLDKVQAGEFAAYDGIFTVMDTKNKTLYRKPKGTYLRGFCLGDWDKIPDLYQKMFAFAEQHGLQLTDYAFERGLNEFMISKMEDYITQIEIRCIDADANPS